MKEIELSPSKIRFMHHRINSNFSTGQSLNETVRKIERHQMNVSDLPKIKVVRKDGYYYTFDNRRLYVYRVLHYRGLLDKVTVRLAPLKFFQPGRFTTKNNGQSIELAVGITLPHSEANSPPSSPETFSDTEQADYEVDLCDLFGYGLDLSDDDDDPYGFNDDPYGFNDDPYGFNDDLSSDFEDYY